MSRRELPGPEPPVFQTEDAYQLPANQLAAHRPGVTMQGLENVRAAGLLTPGNIPNLYNRPVVAMPGGGWGTTFSMSFNIGGKEVLLPTIVNGVRLTNEQAIERYRTTGQHLGIFDTPAHADIYASALHKSQEAMGNYYGLSGNAQALLGPTGTTPQGGIPPDAVSRVRTASDNVAQTQARLSRLIASSPSAANALVRPQVKPVSPQAVIPPGAELKAPQLSVLEQQAQPSAYKGPVIRPQTAMDRLRQFQILPQAPVDVGPGIRAQTAMDRLREARDRLGRLAAPILGLDWQQMAEQEAEGRLQAIAPVDPSMLEQAGKAPGAKYAQEYPPLASFPAWMEKEKDPGVFYLARQQGPEGKEFLKQRNAIMADMEKNGYSPFFDVGKRYHVDPKYYPKPSENLKEGYRPVEEATVNRWRQKVQTPAARQRLQAAYEAGVKYGGHDRWYQMGQLEKAFMKELGAKAGRQRFFEWTQAMASTTAGTSPEMNLMSAQYGRYLRARGEPIPLDMGLDAFGNVVGTGKPASYAMPAPTSGLYLGGNMEQFQKVINEAKGLGWVQPKRTSFNWNFLGRTDMATIDEQMAGLMTPELQQGTVFRKGQWGDMKNGKFVAGKMKKIAAPPKGSYFAYDELISEMAAKNGVSPDEFQAIVWGGKKQAETGYAGKSMMEIVNEAIERTSRISKLPPAEVLRRGIIRAEIPVYGLLGAAGAGAVAAGAAGGKQGSQQ